MLVHTVVPIESSVLLRATDALWEGKSLLRNANSPVTPGFPFICFGTTPIPDATSQTCSILSTVTAIETPGAASHETLTRVQPLISDIVKTVLMIGQRHRTSSDSQSLPNTMSRNLYHLLNNFLAPENTVHFGEEKEAQNPPNYPALTSPSLDYPVGLKHFSHTSHKQSDLTLICQLLNSCTFHSQLTRRNTNSSNLPIRTLCPFPRIMAIHNAVSK